MAIVVKPITVEVSKPNVFQAIAAKQNDCNSRFLKVTFVNEGEKIFITPSASVTINAKRNDGESESFFGEVNDDGTANLPIHSWMLALPGYVECDISIIEADSKLTCTTFSLLIEEAAHGSDDISDDPQYDVLTELIKDTQGLEKEMVAYTDAKTNALDKRVTNLEQGITPSPFVTDDTTAYMKNVPENALPYAEVSKIGGMTRKCDNLIPFPYKDSTKTIGGITFTVTKDNTIIGNGTATEQTLLWLVQSQDIGIKKGETYTLSGCPSGGSDSSYLMEVSCGGKYPQDNGKGISFVAESNIISVYIVIRSGVTLNNIVFKPMLNEGTEALPYEPFFDGLHSAPVTEVESVGKNLIPYPFLNSTLTKEGVTYTDNGDGTVTANGLATNNSIYLLHNYTIPLKAGTYIISGLPSDGNSNTLMMQIATNSGFAKNVVSINGTSFTLTDDVSDMVVQLVVFKGFNANNLVFKPQLELGTEATPYTPYVRNTLHIPTEVQALDGYGEGINDTCYNYVDWEKKQFVKCVNKKVLNGTEAWSFGTTVSGAPRYQLTPTPSLKSGGKDILCDQYETVTTGHTWNDINGIAVNSAFIEIKDSAYGSLAEFKARLAQNPITVYYELAEPIITDISDILPEDNFIGVEGNGTITLKNEYAYDVPSEITYQIKEVSV